jgi:hypothetical protein
MSFCLLPEAENRFTQGLKDGTIDPYKLNQMSSDERRAIFEKVVGEKNAAKEVNAQFEGKMLLKNQKYAYTSWAKKLTGITPAMRTDLASKINKLDHVLDPTEEKAFLSDLAEKKLGIGVTSEEAKKIADLSGKVQDARTSGLSTPEQALKKGFTPSAKDVAHGYAQYDLQKYVSDLKNGATKFKASDLKSPVGVGQAVASLPRRVADVSKSLGASLDDSFALRQGLKTLITHPVQWQKEFRGSFVNIAKGFKNAEEAQRHFKANIMADPLYHQAVKDGVALTKSEDVFPTSLPGKIPVAGRFFNASEVAYEAYAENLRLALYKQYMRQAEGKGLDTSGTFGKNVAKMVNSLTGRGGLGKLEPVSGPINLAFYSLRFLKSNVDTLLLHPLGAGVGGTADLLARKEGAKGVSFAQKAAAKNLVKIIGGISAILATANALKPGSVTYDPRSSDFGKIKIGDTRFEVTGGLDSLVTLAARIASKSSTSSTTGAVSKLNTGEYGAPTSFDVATNFLSNKSSPVGGVILDELKGKNPQGQKTTTRGELGKLVTPLNINNYTELKNDKNSANVLASVISDTLGISTNTYGKSTTQWDPSSSKTLSAFNQKVGASTFKQANSDYNTRLDQFMQKLTSSPVYKALPDDQKKAVVTSGKTKLQAETLKSYGFKAPKSSTSYSKQKKSLLNLAQ